MPFHPLRPLVLGAALVLGTSGCGESLVHPDEVRAQVATASDRELLMTILTRLDAMEARVEQEAATVRAALEAITGIEDLRAAFAPGNSNGNGQGQAQPGLAGDIAALTAMTDSLFVLAGWMATEMASPWSGLESCFTAKVKGTADFKSVTHGQAEGEGGLGVKPWDTGVLAKVQLRQRLGIEFGAGAEFELAALGGCVDWSNLNAAPPVRPGPAPAAAVQMASASPLSSAIQNMPGQLGLSEAGLVQLLQAGTSLVQSGDLSRVPEVAQLLPMPAQALTPLSVVRGRLSSFNAVDLLCGGTNFGNNLGGYVTQGCGYIQGGNLPDLGVYLNLGDNFSSLQNKFGSLCGRFNNVVDRRLVVNTNLPWGGSNVLDVALFPASWNVTC